MEKEKIERINQLKAASRERALTQEELEEQAALRAEYIAGFRAHMQQVLSNVRVQQPDGTLAPLKRKDDLEGSH